MGSSRTLRLAINNVRQIEQVESDPNFHRSRDWLTLPINSLCLCAHEPNQEQGQTILPTLAFSNTFGRQPDPRGVLSYHLGCNPLHTVEKSFPRLVPSGETKVGSNPLSSLDQKLSFSNDWHRTCFYLSERQLRSAVRRLTHGSHPIIHLHLRSPEENQ